MCKQLVDSERISPEHELKFTAIVLSFKPKCSEVFTHRKWVLRKILQQPDLQPFTTLRFLQEDLKVTLLAASKYPSNYNAWNHRKWAMENLVPNCHKTEILKQELKLSHGWTSNHVSDFSGLQFRQYLLQQIFATLSLQVLIVLNLSCLSDRNELQNCSHSTNTDIRIIYFIFRNSLSGVIGHLDLPALLTTNVA
jgi:hypothetical protein